MDGTLSAEERGELEPLLKAHPELEAEREEYLRLRDELRAVLPAEVEPPYPDFFNTHLMRQIEREGWETTGSPAARERAGFWKWLGPWLAPAAAAAVVAAFIAGREMGGGGQAPVAVAPAVGTAPAVYSAIATVDVRTWQSPDDGATVIILDGLQEIPSSVDLLETTAALEEADPGNDVF